MPGWSQEGDRIARSYRFGSHFAATAMVVHIAQVQEELDHHSDLTLGYNTVVVTVNTHSVGGAVTELDFRLAGGSRNWPPATAPTERSHVLDYEAEADAYDATRGGEPRAGAAAEAVLGLVPKDAGRLLDVACGTGIVTGGSRPGGRGCG